ncbi:hypothetical protein BDR05DRAFT_943718 [Suillus weaverae]|nr:hypothetical protein BDR05DRAFT_943718 [Suillus weaverae]
MLYKGKEKANTTTGGKIIRTCKKLNAKVDKVDKHPVQEMIDMDDPAVRTVALDSKLKKFAGQMLERRWNSPDTLTSIKLLDKKPIQLTSGQHYIAALHKAIDKYLKEEESLNKHLLQLQDKEALTEEKVIEYEELHKQLMKYSSITTILEDIYFIVAQAIEKYLPDTYFQLHYYETPR